MTARRRAWTAKAGPTGRLTLLPLALLLIGARGYETRRWTMLLLPSQDQPGGELTVAKDGTITRSPAVQAPHATLGTPVSLAIASIEQSLASGDELHYVTVGGDAAERLDSVPEAYCAVPRANAGTAVRAIFEVAAFGLLRGVNRSSPFSTHCFVDQDGDGRLDTAFLSGARREADLAPQPVGPLDVAIERNRPIEGVSEARITFGGAIGRARNARLRFRFETANAAGETVQSEIRAQVDVRNLPRTVAIQGAEIEILSYDAAARSVRVRLVRPMAPGGFAFTPPPQVTYIPIFVPR